MTKRSIAHVLNVFFGALFALDRAAPLKLTVAVLDRLDHPGVVAAAAAQVITRARHALDFLRCISILRVDNTDALAHATPRAHRVQFGVALTKVGRALHKHQFVLEHGHALLSNSVIFLLVSKQTASGPMRDDLFQLLDSLPHSLGLQLLGQHIAPGELIANDSEFGHNLPADLDAARARDAVALANLSHILQNCLEITQIGN